MKSKAMTFLDEAVGEPMTFGHILRIIREAEGWTQAQMAKKLSITMQHLANVENGEDVSVDCAGRYGEILGYGRDAFVRYMAK